LIFYSLPYGKRVERLFSLFLREMFVRLFPLPCGERIEVRGESTDF
jgi:hypothetical protein